MHQRGQLAPGQTTGDFTTVGARPLPASLEPSPSEMTRRPHGHSPHGTDDPGRSPRAPSPTPEGATWLSWPSALVPGQRVHLGRTSSHDDQAIFPQPPPTMPTGHNLLLRGKGLLQVLKQAAERKQASSPESVSLLHACQPPAPRPKAGSTQHQPETRFLE